MPLWLSWQGLGTSFRCSRMHSAGHPASTGSAFSCRTPDSGWRDTTVDELVVSRNFVQMLQYAQRGTPCLHGISIQLQDS